MDGPLDESLGFELPQALGEEPIGDAGDGGGDVAEVTRPVDQAEQDGAAPATADQFDGLVVAMADDRRCGCRRRGRRGRVRACFGGAGIHRISVAKRSLGLARLRPPRDPAPGAAGTGSCA